MPVQMSCSCGEQFPVAGDAAGRPVRCPACGREQPAPPAAEPGPDGPPACEAAGIHVAGTLDFPPRPTPATMRGSDTPSLLPGQSEAATLDAPGAVGVAYRLRGEFGDYELLEEIARG